MSVFLVVRLILFSAISAVLVWSCTTNKDCQTKCPTGYHEQCGSDKQCFCPIYQCLVTADCPIGNHSGCPLPEKKQGSPLCAEGICICVRPPY